MYLYDSAQYTNAPLVISLFVPPLNGYNTADKELITRTN